MIHVCFGLYDKTGHYSKFIGTTMLSIFKNTNSEVMIHIFHDNTLTDDNRDKLIHIAGQYHQLVKFYNVEELCADKLSVIIETLPPDTYASHFTVGMFYRFFIAHILPAEIEKAIYLDADIIVNLDINELWQIELEDKPLGAIPNLFQIADEKVSIERTMKRILICKEGFIKPEDYFNSGVLLLNLRFMRNADEILLNGMKFLEEHNQLQFLDQDLLNYCFSTSYLKLPVKFNRFVMLARPENELTTGKMIYHYAGGKVGLGLDMIDPFNRLWWSYFIKTPFFDAETIGRLYAGVQKLHVELKQSMITVSAIMSGKTRAFFTLPHNFKAIKAIFSVRDDEDIILADNPESLRKLIYAMKKAEGKKIFFIVLPNFPFNLLIQEGFIPGKDFVNGLEFLSEAQGLPLNSYPFVQAM